MRGVVASVLLLCLGTALAGCEHPHIVEQGKAAAEAAFTMPDPVDTAKGRDAGAIAAPVWKPGYHFTYTEQGARDVQEAGKSYRLNQTAGARTLWGPRQGLNYTVVRVDTGAFGDTTALALHMDEGQATGPRLLGFQVDHLTPLDAGIATSCSSHLNCTEYPFLLGADDAAHILDFPLRDGPAHRDQVESIDAPWMPEGPIDVATLVLGVKDVPGPFGTVAAVHVHQDFSLNITDLLREVEGTGTSSGARADDGVTDLRINGTMHASRDVYYAPSLLNVVLDQAMSEGTLVHTYVQDGHHEAYTQTWQDWRRSTLTAATYDPRPAMGLQEIQATVRADLPFGSPRISVTVDPLDPNVADRESSHVAIRPIAATAASTRIDVWSPTGAIVASTHEAALDFTPTTVDPFLVVASAYDAEGRLVDRQYSGIWAWYGGSATVQCPLVVDATTSCEGVALPRGLSLSYLSVLAQAVDAFGGTAPVPIPARLAIDTGDGQEISSDAHSGFGAVSVRDPWMESPWTAYYKPQAAAAMSVTFSFDLTPGWMPNSVYVAAAGSP